MIDLLTHIWKSDASQVMFFVNLVMFLIVGAIAWQAFRYFFKDYKLNQQKVDLLIEKSQAHDEEHMKFNNRIESMIKEMKSNREQDQKQAQVTHALVQFLAKKSKIDIPAL